jgi:GNAT superfamily N-acetyltransferase
MSNLDTTEQYPPPSSDPSAAPTVPSRGASRAFDWVPIRALSARHRPRILKHLLALETHDRWLRFGSAASDSQITHYVDLIDFETDEVFGIFNRRLELLAAAHLAYGRNPVGSREPASTEFGVSVAAHARGRGWGTRLFERAALHARNRGVGRLTIHALSENHPMLLIARKAGAIVVRDGSESQADVILPPGDLSSHFEQLVEDAAAALDFRLKAKAKRVGEWMGAYTPDPADR